MRSNSKQNRQKHRTQKDEKLIFNKRTRKCRLHIKQNNDHARVIHKTQFLSSLVV